MLEAPIKSYCFSLASENIQRKNISQRLKKICKAVKFEVSDEQFKIK
jgi:DNA polymerase III delta prime subunit